MCVKTFIYSESLINDSSIVALEADGLVAGDDDGLVDVVGRASAGEVVDRSGETLEHGTYGLDAAETLHEFVCDVAHLKVGEYEHVGTTGNVAVGSLAAAYAGHEGGVGLELSVEREGGCHFLGYLCGFDYLVDLLVLRATLGREAEYSHAGLHTGDVACGLGCRYSYLGEFGCGGVGDYGAVGKMSRPLVP